MSSEGFQPLDAHGQSSRVNGLPLYVHYPAPLETGGWEFRYGQAYCRRQMRLALDGLEYAVRELGREADVDTLPPEAWVLWLNDPLLIMAQATLQKLCEGLRKGYAGVAPCLIPTNFVSQQAAPDFMPVHWASFEALNPGKRPATWQDVEELDPACGLFRAAWLHARRQGRRANGRLAVLQQDLAFSFRASTGHPRGDLIAMIPKGMRVMLDVGCANGAMGRQWLSQEAQGQVDGLEPDPHQAREARQAYRQVWEAALETFTPPGLYDIIVCGDVIEHLDDPWTQLARLRDWLRPGGYLLLSVPGAGHWSLVADQAQGRFDYLPWGLTCITHRRWFTEDSLREALQDAGLVPQHWEREQPRPSPQGEAFIQTLVSTGIGNEQSLRTLQMRVLAQKPR